MSIAISFASGGYLVKGETVVGLQSAGNGFLRAAVAARDSQAMWGYTPRQEAAAAFQELVASFDPAAEARWVPPHRADILQQLGTVYLPDPSFGAAARFRLRAGVASYSLCGVTHTTATHAAMDCIADLPVLPVMEWDALICTSTAVVRSVEVILEQKQAYLNWRFKGQVPITRPLLPVIPLGVHCRDFESTADVRAAARSALAIGADEVVALFVGRICHKSKAHPAAMYTALEAAARTTGKRVTLIQCGWFAGDKIKAAFESAGRELCPSVRLIFTDGREDESRRRSWSASDLFISLSDNIQETFGLTPIEAMAAGLPAVVTDWNGYKDTVRDGIDGFRIPTWMPSAPLGEQLALAYESGQQAYDDYTTASALLASVDHGVLIDRLTALIADGNLRQSMGRAARERAINDFDWSVIYTRYQALWAEQSRIRRASLKTADGASWTGDAPKVDAGRLDPFTTFGHYATSSIRPATIVTLSPNANPAACAALVSLPIFSYAKAALPSAEGIETLFAALANGERDLQSLSRDIGMKDTKAALIIAVLAKMGFVALR